MDVSLKAVVGIGVSVVGTDSVVDKTCSVVVSAEGVVRTSVVTCSVVVSISGHILQT